MLLATLLVLAVTAAVFAVTQIGALVTLLFVIAVLVLAYKRLPLLAFSIVFSILFVIYTWFGAPGGLWKGLLLLMLVVMWLFNIRPLRKALISRPFLKAYLRMLPTMSDTERDALEAGGVWWDGELFTGKPDWSKLLGTPAPRLTPEEQAFLDGPTEELCALVNDFDRERSPGRQRAGVQRPGRDAHPCGVGDTGNPDRHGGGRDAARPGGRDHQLVSSAGLQLGGLAGRCRLWSAGVGRSWLWRAGNQRHHALDGPCVQRCAAVWHALFLARAGAQRLRRERLVAGVDLYDPDHPGRVRRRSNDRPQRIDSGQ